MACLNCGTEYSLLKKEVGCENCGFSFCTKCCKKREIQSENLKSKKLMCNKCYENINREKNVNQISPPMAHKKRMEALKKQSFSLDSGSSQWGNEKDKEIAERLHRLKRERIKDLPSENEIEERLAKLKNMDPLKYTAPPIQVFRPSEKRSLVQQADDLMQQIKEEVDLDSHLIKPEDEIEERLALLRDHSSKKNAEANIFQNLSTSSECSSEIMDAKSADNEFQENYEDTDEEETKRLVEKLMATTVGDEMEDLDNLQENEKSTENEENPEEEFPWCIICTANAKIRCFGCDNDLYCIRCFKECHDSLDIKNHKTCPFLSPKKSLI